MSEQEEAKQVLINRWYNYLQLRGEMECVQDVLFLPDVTPEDLYLTIQIRSIEPIRVQVTREDCRKACEIRASSFYRRVRQTSQRKERMKR